MRAPRILALVAGSITLAAVLFLFVLPSRTYLAQRQSLAAAQTRLNVFRDENAKLAASAGRLQTDAEIERIAREQYGLVKPGEKTFVIVPSSGANGASATGSSASGSSASGSSASGSSASGSSASGSSASGSSATKAAPRGLISRVWHDIQFWN